MRYLRSIIVAACFPMVAAAATTMFPVPKAAIHPGHHVIAPGIAEQDHFWLKEAFPSSSAIDHYDRIFAKWQRCRSRDDGWDSFGDLAKGEQRYVHQRLRYWVNAANDTAVTLALVYNSKGTQSRPVPENDDQFVVLVRHMQPNASKLLSDVGAKCGKDT